MKETTSNIQISILPGMTKNARQWPSWARGFPKYINSISEGNIAIHSEGGSRYQFTGAYRDIRFYRDIVTPLVLYVSRLWECGWEGGGWWYRALIWNDVYVNISQTPLIRTWCRGFSTGFFCHWFELGHGGVSTGSFSTGFVCHWFELGHGGVLQ